ncbi:hypothetical protein B0H15DRAFT_652906 [Mycena belliarum]|uniref:Uncharacterized protein n=1 Tax=Mycena belliarum TaxID=1033014 RepID=A0AAD6TUF0_9AGAR|nr:hypothetical protein B0H15DRAFT_652906 [Mycena belliae]
MEQTERYQEIHAADAGSSTTRPAQKSNSALPAKRRRAPTSTLRAHGLISSRSICQRGKVLGMGWPRSSGGVGPAELTSLSLSSEPAFFAAGITISKRRNRLKPDIVEGLQFLK